MLGSHQYSRVSDSRSTGKIARTASSSPTAASTRATASAPSSTTARIKAATTATPAIATAATAATAEAAATAATSPTTETTPARPEKKRETSNLRVDGRRHGNLRASAARHRARLLHGLGQHAQGVVHRSLRLIEHVLAGHTGETDKRIGTDEQSGKKYWYHQGCLNLPT